MFFISGLLKPSLGWSAKWLSTGWCFGPTTVINFVRCRFRVCIWNIVGQGNRNTIIIFISLVWPKPITLQMFWIELAFCSFIFCIFIFVAVLQFFFNFARNCKCVVCHFLYVSTYFFCSRLETYLRRHLIFISRGGNYLTCLSWGNLRLNFCWWRIFVCFWTRSQQDSKFRFKKSLRHVLN